MAERRMFAKSIMDSDDFMNLPFSAQALYVHLGMRADDDGFIGNAKSILRMIGASEEDFALLVKEGYLKTFDSSVVAIVHWKTHNYIQKDRYKPTVYRKEREQMYPHDNQEDTEEEESESEETGGKKKTGYKVRKGNIIEVDFSVSNPDTQVRIGKDSIGKDSTGKDSTGKGSIGKGSIGKDSTGKDSTGKDSTDNREASAQGEAFEGVCQLIMDSYNKICTSLAPVTSLTKARKERLAALLHNHSPVQLQRAFRKAQECDFLRGKGKNGWKASFDWLIKEDNFLKVMEGAYEAQQKQSEEEPPSYDLEAYENSSIFD